MELFASQRACIYFNESYSQPEEGVPIESQSAKSINPENPINPEKSVISKRPITVGMVAGEVSGDILGSGLIQAIRKRYPNASFVGIGGPLMLEQGFQSQVSMERLSVMGLIEVLGRIFELIGIRRRLKHFFLNNRPDVFIGIDAPDFNIGLELALRKRGIKTGHYVSPSVWAWRQKRVFKIARAVDLMLTLFPFEAKFYKAHKVAVRFVGHPLADSIPLIPNKAQARAKFGLEDASKVVALLPGSRSGEIAYVGESFIDTARWLYERDPEITFLLPYVNDARRIQVEEMIHRQGGGLPIKLINGQSRDVMSASDVVVLASGTATLEAMLLKRPMVVAYRVSKFTHYIMKRLLKTQFISLPNLLAGKELVPELIQDLAQPDLIGQRVLERLNSAKAVEMQESFTRLHKELRCDASEQAADAISNLLEHSASHLKVKG